MNLKEVIQGLNKDGLSTCNAVVNEVNLSNRTCDVSPVNGDADFFDVRLQSIIEGDKGFFMVPKKGSIITISAITNEIAVVVNASEVDLIEFSIGSIKMDIDDKGMFLGSAQSDLLTEMNNLIELIEGLHDIMNKIQVVITTPGNPSGPVLPNIIAEVTANKLKFIPVKNKLKTFLR